MKTIQLPAVSGSSVTMTPSQGQFGSEPAQYLDEANSFLDSIKVGVLTRRNPNGTTKSTVKVFVPTEPTDTDAHPTSGVSILVSVAGSAAANASLRTYALNAALAVLNDVDVQEGIGHAYPLQRQATSFSAGSTTPVEDPDNLGFDMDGNVFVA